MDERSEPGTFDRDEYSVNSYANSGPNVARNAGVLIPKTIEEVQGPKRKASMWSVLMVVAALFWGIGGYFRWLRVGNENTALAVVELDSVSATRDDSAFPKRKIESDDFEGSKRFSTKEQDSSNKNNRLSNSHGQFYRRWLTDIPEPNEVSYTIKSGGTLRRVANLFKIHYHEIIALNPTRTLDEELSAKSKVIIARRTQEDSSESIGFPDGGSLSGAIPMLEGPGRVIRSIPWKTWATASTVGILDRVFREWEKARGNTSPILVGNLSQRHGGKLAPHDTHRSGRDMDIGFVLKSGVYEKLAWRKIDERNLDVGKTWSFLQILVGTGQIELIYMNRSIQQLLYDYAKKHELFHDSSLEKWIEYPRRPGTTDARIVHSRGHDDHMHVRFSCPPNQPRCKSRNRY